MAADLSIQERLYPSLTCFGCGHANQRGLKLRSYPAGDGSVSARFTPWPEHGNGFGFVNGGILATVLDCHSAAAVALASEDGQGWDPQTPLPYLTAGIDVAYVRPTPLKGTVELWAEVSDASARAITVDVELRWDGKPRATARATWKRWQPRP